MLTLYDSVGNEFSHEIGHHYGLGHYPGSQGENMFWAAHHADSGWGYIAYRNKMRGNLAWHTRNLGDGKNGVPNFLKQYAYGWDAMSGGATNSSISRYTHYTGYSTHIRIQPHFGARHVGMKAHQVVIKFGIKTHAKWKWFIQKYQAPIRFGTTVPMDII